MTLTEFVSVASAPGGVLLALLYLEIKSRMANSQPSADPIIQRLDALVEANKAHERAFANFAKDLAILMDRSDR